mgnify:CR=1 FL=1
MSALTTHKLNVLTLPLNGIQLIEASAGTGKTWTLAALYVRLILGHGWNGQGLMPPQILVMTFTEAATAELRDRIRARLAKAAQFWLLGIPFALSITVLSVVPFSPLSRLLGSKVFWFAGKISMVFYLLHVPVTWWIQRISPMATYEVRFLSIVVASILVHFLIELPANRCIKNLRRL